MVIGLPELDVAGGQGVQGPGGGDQPRAGGDLGLSVAQGAVEVGRVVEGSDWRPVRGFGAGGGRARKSAALAWLPAEAGGIRNGHSPHQSREQ